MQRDQCDAESGSVASSFYCTDAQDEAQADSSASVCFGGIARGACVEVENAPGCPMLQATRNGLCGVRSNLESNLRGNFSEAVGIVYGPDSMCLGVGRGGLMSAEGAGYPDITTTCMRAECAQNGRSYEVVLSTGDGGSEQRRKCPEGEMLELGESDGFAAGVRTSPATGACALKWCSTPRPMHACFVHSPLGS